MNKIIMTIATFCIIAMASAQAQEPLPASAQAYLKSDLAVVGNATYRKFGLGIYRATLWSPGGVWNDSKPRALELHYLRDLSHDTLADNLTDNLRDQNAADNSTLARWIKWVDTTMPASVQEGDIMVGAELPNGDITLFLNGKEIGRTSDAALGHAFFNIWLGRNSDMRDALLGKTD